MMKRIFALLLCAATLLASLSFVGCDMSSNKKKTEKKEEDKRRKSKFLGILPAIGAVIAFILTEDMRLPMILVDKWTLLMLIILAVNLILAFLTRNKDKEKDEEKENFNQSRIVY